MRRAKVVGESETVFGANRTGLIAVKWFDVFFECRNPPSHPPQRKSAIKNLFAIAQFINKKLLCIGRGPKPHCSLPEPARCLSRKAMLMAGLRVSSFDKEIKQKSAYDGQQGRLSSLSRSLTASRHAHRPPSSRRGGLWTCVRLARNDQTSKINFCAQKRDENKPRSVCQTSIRDCSMRWESQIHSLN
jgi:hypothetical protein